MIGALTGLVREVDEEGVLLDVGGVGYRLAVLPLFRAEAKVGATATLVTYLHVRENDLALYGFTEKAELTLFRMLLDVPGVGPKSALAILSIAPVEVLVRAISSGETAILTKVSGVGRKTAERIVVELKTRLEREHPRLAEQGAAPHADVVEALVALGYSLHQAREAVRHLPKETTTVEEGIRVALQALGQRAHAPR